MNVNTKTREGGGLHQGMVVAYTFAGIGLSI